MSYSIPGNHNFTVISGFLQTKNFKFGPNKEQFLQQISVHHIMIILI